MVKGINKELIKIAKSLLADFELVPYGTDSWDGNVFLADVKEDEFVHFTPLDRLEQIMKDKKLLLNPPYDKFGPDLVYAVSTKWGTYLPGVQTTHYKTKKLGAVLFKTNVIPKFGFTEEVGWDKDVHFTTAKAISASQGASLLRNTPFKPDNKEFIIRYV